MSKFQLQNLKLSKQEVEKAAKNSTTMVSFINALGYKAKRNSGRGAESARFYIKRYQIDVSHFVNAFAAKIASDLNPKLKELVPVSNSWRDLITKLGYKSFTSVKWRIDSRVKELNLDTSHFLGSGWRKGNAGVGSFKINLEDVLVENSTYQNTNKIKKYLVKEGILEYKCNKCGISEWMGEKLVLQLDHINGKRPDNRKENLRLLCPNCHSQTETWGGKKRILAL